MHNNAERERALAARQLAAEKAMRKGFVTDDGAYGEACERAYSEAVPSPTVNCGEI